MTGKSTSQRIVRKADIEAGGFRFKHPLNPNAEIVFSKLAEMAGLADLGVNIGRVPPGRDSFMYHRHYSAEEWVYILDGVGETIIEGERHAVSAGDFVGYAAGEAHNLRNVGDSDLIYLMGGKQLDAEVVDFPDTGQRFVVSNGRYEVFDEAQARDPFAGIFDEDK